jgi:hypothetical protein
MEMQQTHCHATVPVTLLWKCYKDLTCHDIINSHSVCYICCAVSVIGLSHVDAAHKINN